MGWLAGKDAGVMVGWLGADEDFATFPGFGPDGVATLLGLEAGFKVTFSWATAIVDHKDGTDQRVSNLDRPVQRYDGEVVLVGTGPRLTRGRMARYAASQAAFLLALPHEALTLLDDASGSILTVSSTYLALVDWAQVGQRVVVALADGSQAMNGVIQSVDGAELELDVAPGSIGKTGAVVMPAMAVYLEPQQDFARYVTAVERWGMKARAAIFDYAPAHATLDLQAQTGDAALAGAVLMARPAGLFGEMVINFANAGTTSLVELGLATTVNFHNGVTTLADVAALLDTSSNLKLTGTYNPATVLHSGDSFTAVLEGTEASGAFGTGATLTMYDGHPVWDRELANAGTNTDSVLGMTEIIDLGGVPYPIASAIDPAWGRALALTSDDIADRQWFKLMLATLRGSQRVFWLATWASDFTWVSSGASSITVRTDDDSDLAAWYPNQRDRVQIRQVDGTISYTQITGVTDHGDGTQTLAITETLSGAAVDLISWLEPCRLEQDAVEVTFAGGGRFSFSIKARAHAMTDPDLLEVEP